MTVLLLSPPTTEQAIIVRLLAGRGYTVATAETAAAGLAALQRTAAALIVVDLAGAQDALRLLKMLGSRSNRPPVLAIADRRQPRVTGEALRLGVVDIISRPVVEADVLAAVDNAAAFRELVARAPSSPEPAEETAHVSGLWAVSAHMRAVLDIVRRIGPSRCPVLVTGEPGSGRSKVARALHAEASRAKLHGGLAFIEIDCAVVEAEAFDQALAHLWPASSAGPVEPRTGSPDRPSAGNPQSASENPAPESPPGHRQSTTTLFLRSLEALPAVPQAILERAILRDRLAGDGDAAGPPSRLVAAAEAGIGDLVERGQFRRELFDRLSVVRVDLQPLRQRPQDIGPLAMHFLKEACRRHGQAPKTLTRGALALLGALPWRGNAIELRVLMERLALLVPRGVVLLEDVLAHVQLDGAKARGRHQGSLREARERFEREFVGSVLAHHHGRMGSAARELGIERTNLYRKIKQLNIRWDS
jgi:DNA-binding NtrC family response regulator